ncbi:MAG: V-type ATPase subunit [Pyrobaculum sp.]
MSSVLKRPSLGPRVRGLRTRELSRDKLISLIYANTLDEFLNFLKTTSYHITLDKLTKENLKDLRGELIRTYLDRVRSIYLGSRGDAKNVILASLKYFEYDNIRNVTVSIKAGKNPEEFVLWEPLEFTKRRHVVSNLIGAKNLEEVSERLRQMKHPAAKAFELAAKYGEDKISVFIDRQWLEDYINNSLTQKDKSLNSFVLDLAEYFNSLIAIRARVWGLSEEVEELVVGKPTPLVLSAVRDPPTKFLEQAEARPWGRILVDIVAGSPSLENIAVAMDNIYPAYVKSLADIYIVKFSEFSLGTLAAHLEYLRAEVTTILRAAALLAEGISVEKRRQIFEPLTRL